VLGVVLGVILLNGGCVAIFGIFYLCLYVVTSHMGLSLPPQTLVDFKLFSILGGFDFGLFSSYVLFRYNLFCVSTLPVDCHNNFLSRVFVLVMVFSVGLGVEGCVSELFMEFGRLIVFASRSRVSF